MQTVLHPTITALKPYVHSINIFEIERQKLETGVTTNKTVPDALADLWFINGAPLISSFDNKTFLQLPDVCAWGLLNKCSFLNSQGVSQILSVKFHPWAFELFFAIKISELQNSYASLEDFTDNKTITRFWKVHALGITSEAVDAVQQLLMSLLDESRRTKPYVIVAYERIKMANGNLLIHELAKELAVSRQHLNKSFKESFGLTVKQFICVLRARLCIDFQINNGTSSLADLAYAFEFFDQAHFIRQFKSIVGETPRSFFARKHLLKQHLRE